MIRKKWAESNAENFRDAKGYTLIEVLLAIAIFAIGILGVGSMQISSVNHNFSARMRTEATLLAAQIVEERMSTAYNNVQSAPPENNGIYTWEITVNNDYPIPSVKTVELEVCWEENHAAPADCDAAPRKKTVTLDFIRANL
jgi:type IV pilus assembly protein PilV